MLWLPILLSGVFVFIASIILCMVLPFWHRPDFGRLAEEKAVMDALANQKTGQYLVPCVDWGKVSDEERDAMGKRPMALMMVRNPGGFPLGIALLSYFVYGIVVAIFIAYLTGHTRTFGAPYLEIFRIAGAAGFLAFGFKGVPDSIWYGKPWIISIKEMIDGLIYALLIAGTFGWLWPK
jgi:hypothetical protein